MKCLRCSSEAVEGERRCERHLALCLRCSEMAAPGKRRCEKHLQLHQTETRQGRENKLKCVWCNRASVPGKRRCQEHLGSGNIARRRYDQAHHPKVIEATRIRKQAWRQRDGNGSRENRRREGIRRAATVVPFTAEQLRERLSVYDRCWICGDPRWTEADHVKPLAVGGPHMLANLRPACSTCNRQKGATWPFLPRKVLIHHGHAH